MTAQGDETRERLLDVAEGLFGRQGVGAVSLREIRIAAGARNTAAIQFHFGSRAGLLQALADRHMPRIAEIQDRLYHRVIERGTSEQGSGAADRALVEVLVRPVAEYTTRGPGERAWVKIMNDLASAPDLQFGHMTVNTPEAGVQVGRILFERLTASTPRELARERFFLLAQTSVNLCANFARLLDDPERSRRMVPAGVFIESLTDVMTAGLFASTSTATSTLLSESSASKPRSATR